VAAHQEGDAFCTPMPQRDQELAVPYGKQHRALLAGAHVCTVPFGVMNHLCDNSLTALGTVQFQEHTRLMTMKVGELVRAQNPVCESSETLSTAMVKMTESRLGTVTLVDGDGNVAGIFTDGDLRRHLKNGSNLAAKKVSVPPYRTGFQCLFFSGGHGRKNFLKHCVDIFGYPAFSKGRYV